MGRVLGARDHDIAGLNVPAQDDLGIALAILFAKFREQRFLDQRLVSMTQRIPCLDDDAFFIQKCLQFLLLRVGVHLCLEHGRLYLADVQNLLHLLRGKVGKANGAHLALFVGFLHEPVTCDIVACGLVDQQQVNVVCSQALERLFYRIFLLIKTGPQFGFQKNLISRNPRFPHSPANGFFVHIGIGRVNQAVSALKSGEDGCLRFIRSKQKGANACHGHFDSVVQSCVFHK